MKYRLFLFGDIIYETDDLLIAEAYKNTYIEALKKHIIIEQNTLIKK
jgi:hypothetical protein